MFQKFLLTGFLDLTKALMPNTKLKFSGIRPGEKINEELISENDAMRTLSYKDKYIILPNSEYQHSISKYLKTYKKSKLCERDLVIEAIQIKSF